MQSFEVVALYYDGGLRTVATASTRQVAEQIARVARRVLDGAAIYVAETSREPWMWKTKSMEVLS